MDSHKVKITFQVAKIHGKLLFSKAETKKTKNAKRIPIVQTLELVKKMSEVFVLDSFSFVICGVSSRYLYCAYTRLKIFMCFFCILSTMCIQRTLTCWSNGIQLSKTNKIIGPCLCFFIWNISSFETKPNQRNVSGFLCYIPHSVPHSLLFEHQPSLSTAPTKNHIAKKVNKYEKRMLMVNWSDCHFVLRLYTQQHHQQPPPQRIVHKSKSNRQFSIK